jgi:hypothetical protein
MSVNDWPMDPLITRALTHTDEDIFLQTRPIIISLGDTCQPALNLMYNKLRFMAYPFDWLVVPFEAMYDIIKTDFAYCKQREYFVNEYDPQCNGVRPMNTHYPAVHFVHAKWENLFEDLQRRINRFHKAIQYGEHYKKTVFFILHSLTFRDHSVNDTVNKLCELLSTKFPNLDFVLVVMHHDPSMRYPFKAQNCIFCYLQHDGWTQTSYGEWTQKLKECGLINPYSAHDAFSEHPFQ